MSESLNCNFYEYTGDPRVANKSMGTAVHTCSSIAPLEALSDLEIKLLINYPYHIDGYENTSPGASVYPSSGSQVPAVMRANYVAIDNNWYQITSKERLPGNALAIYATLDGVKSYWNSIRVCSCMFKRSSNAAAPDFQDPEYVVQCGYLQDTVDGPGIGDGSIIVLGYVK